ncbi:MAG: aspartate/glutamate racemase family protein [Caulobacteraceae bacterium]
MAIGVFDSGVGGLSIHRALVERLPSADFIYLADQANAPYGVRGGDEIVDLTRESCIRLFAEGASLVVLACNTASAIALRRLQQTWLPAYRASLGRPVNILGIIVPTIEAATGLPWSHERAQGPVTAVEAVGIFSTPATVASQVYEIEIDKRRGDVAVVSEPCPTLARLIEAGVDQDLLEATVRGHVEALLARIGRPPDRAILGCTHYEIVADMFVRALPPGLKLIHQPSAVAEAMAGYLATHREYDPGQSGLRRFLTTGSPGAQNRLVEVFWGEALHFDTA